MCLIVHSFKSIRMSQVVGTTSGILLDQYIYFTHIFTQPHHSLKAN